MTYIRSHFRCALLLLSVYYGELAHASPFLPAQAIDCGGINESGGLVCSIPVMRWRLNSEIDVGVRLVHELSVGPFRLQESVWTLTPFTTGVSRVKDGLRWKRPGGGERVFSPENKAMRGMPGLDREWMLKGSILAPIDCYRSDEVRIWRNRDTGRALVEESGWFLRYEMGLVQIRSPKGTVWRVSSIEFMIVGVSDESGKSIVAVQREENRITYNIGRERVVIDFHDAMVDQIHYRGRLLAEVQYNGRGLVRSIAHNGKQVNVEWVSAYDHKVESANYPLPMVVKKLGDASFEYIKTNRNIKIVKTHDNRRIAYRLRLDIGGRVMLVARREEDE